MPSGSNQARIDTAFTYHRPTSGDINSISVIRGDCKDLAECIDALVPDGREKSIALTKIEEAMMWANAGIVRRHA